RNIWLEDLNYQIAGDANLESIVGKRSGMEVLDVTMQNFLIMKELVDYYSGPNMVTAKQEGDVPLPKDLLSSEAPAANDSSLTHDSAQVEEGKGYRDDDGYYKGGHGGYDDDGGYDGGYGGYDGRHKRLLRSPWRRLLQIRVLWSTTSLPRKMLVLPQFCRSKCIPTSRKQQLTESSS
ncbi:hypothetical protein Tco_0575642, partial [Tanacetum coccineum]